MKLFKFTLLMAGILLCGSILGQSPTKLTPPKMSMNVQKGIGFGADPDLYRIYDTNVIDISVNTGDYGDSVVCLGFVVKKDGKVIDKMSDYGSMSIFLPGTGNYEHVPAPAIVYPDTTFEVLSSRGRIPGDGFYYNKYHDSIPDGISLNLLRVRKLRLLVVWNVPGTYTVEWVLSTRNTKDTLYDVVGMPMTHLIALTPFIYESFNTKPGNTILMDTMTMVLKKPEIALLNFPDTIDTFDSIPRFLYTKANSYIDQKGYIAFFLNKIESGTEGTATSSDGAVGILSEDSSGLRVDKYSNEHLVFALDYIGAVMNFGGGANPEGALGAYDSLTKTVFAEMFEEGSYKMCYKLMRKTPGSVSFEDDELLAQDCKTFVVKQKIRPTVVFYPNAETTKSLDGTWSFQDNPIEVPKEAEFFGEVEFKANDFADTTGKISFVVKKDGMEINPADYGYLKIGDCVFTQANYAHPSANTFLLGEGDTTLRVDAKWNTPGLYEIYAYEDHYVKGSFRRHLAGDTLRMKVVDRPLPFLWLQPTMEPDTVPNYTTYAYYWFDLMKSNGCDEFKRAYVDLKYEIAYSTDSLNWDTVGMNFDDYGFMQVVPQLNNNMQTFISSIPEYDTLHYWYGTFPMRFKQLTGSDLIRLGALDTATKVDIIFKKAGFYRVIYSFEQWNYPNQSLSSYVGSSSKYNAVPFLWLSHDTTIFHIHDSILPSAEVIPSMAHMGTDLDYHVGVRMDAGSYQYSNYTDWAYIKYELLKKDEHGVYQPVTDVAACGNYTLTHKNGTVNGTTNGKLPSWNSAYLLEKLHNDTLGIDFRCKREAAGDYAMHVQVIQYDIRNLRYPTTASVNSVYNLQTSMGLTPRYIGEDSIRHGLLMDTIFYVTFDSLKNPVLTVTPDPEAMEDNEPICYAKDVDYYFNATVDANDYVDSIVSLRYYIYAEDANSTTVGVDQLITNVSDYGTFVVNGISITKGSGILPASPVALPVTKTVPVEINWKKEGRYTFVYEFVGHTQGMPNITYTRDTIELYVCDKMKPSFVILPDPIYSNDSNGFGDEFQYRFIGRVNPGDFEYNNAWLVTSLSYEDVTTGAITPVNKLSDYNATVSLQYGSATYDVLNGVDTIGDLALPLSTWAQGNITGYVHFPQMGNYHLNMRVYQIKDGMQHAKFIDTTLVVRIRDVDSVTLNTNEIQNHINNSLPYTTHVDSVFNIKFNTCDRYMDSINPFVSLEYRVIYEDFGKTTIDTIKGDFSPYGHLKAKIGDQVLTLANGQGSIPGDSRELYNLNAISLRDLYDEGIQFIPNVHPQGNYTFEFFVKEWRDTIGSGPEEMMIGSRIDTVLKKAKSMDVAIVSKLSGFTVKYNIKWPTVDIIPTNEDSVIHKDFNKYPINCGQPYKTGVLYTFDFICHPNSFPDSLGGLFFQIYKDGKAWQEKGDDFAENIDSLYLTFRGTTIHITKPLGNLATLFTGIDSLRLGRVYDPVTGDITPIHMAVKWKPGAVGKYMATGLVLKYTNGQKTMEDLASATGYFLVKDEPTVEVSTNSIYNQYPIVISYPTQGQSGSDYNQSFSFVLDSECRVYEAYDTLNFNFDINPGTYDTNYTSLDVLVSYQKDWDSEPVIIDTLSKIGASADYLMDILGRTEEAPKAYAMDAVKSVPAVCSQDVVGKEDSLKSILLKHLAGNTISFRPYLTEAGIYNFTFTLNEWDSVSSKVSIEGVAGAGGTNGNECYILWQGSYCVEIVPPTISVDPVFPEVTTYTDSVDYPFFINTTNGSYDSLMGYVHYKAYHLFDENGNAVDTAITNLDAYGKMKFEHPVHGSRFYAPNSGEGNVPVLDSLYKLQRMLTDIMWYQKGTYRIVYSLDIVPNSVNIPKAYDTLDMEVGEKIKPAFEISNFDPTSNYPTNIEQNFDLRLISNDYALDYGDIQYKVLHNDTLIAEKYLNSVYGDVNVDVDNLDLCGISHDGNFSMRSNGRLPGQRGGIDFFRLGIFDTVRMHINANFKVPGEYKIIFNLLARDTTGSTALCTEPNSGIMNAGANGRPTIIITRDSLIIHVVDRPNLPSITILPEVCDPNVVVPTNVEQVYQVLVDTNDWADMNATIRYEIKHNGTPIAAGTMANYGSMKVSKNGVMAEITEPKGFMVAGPVTNVPMRALQDADLKTYLNFTTPGVYTMEYSLFGWGDSINKPAVYLSKDSIKLKVADRVMPTTQNTLYAEAHPAGVQDTFKVYLHAAEYEDVMGRVAIQIFHSPDSGKTLNPITNISDFGATSIRFDGQAIGYAGAPKQDNLSTYIDTIPYQRFVRLGAVSGVPVEVISNWDSVGTYVYTYEVIQWDCYDLSELDATTYQHRPIYGEIAKAHGHPVHVLYRDTLMMHVYPQYPHVEDAVELCADELPYEHDGTGYYVPASFNRDSDGEVIMATVRNTMILPLKTVHGLDSIVYLDVQVHPVYEFTYVDTLRGLGQYNNHGFVETFNMPGHYTLKAVYPSVHGCDSVIVDSLLVVPTYYFYDSLTLCSSELPYQWRGKQIVTPGVYSDSLLSMYGADSIYYLNFKVNPAYYYYDTISIPMWNTASVYNNVPTVKLPYIYAVHNAAAYVCNQVGDYVFHFSTVNGCDSIAYVNVKTYPMMYTQASLNGNRDNDQVFCYGDRVTLNVNVDTTFGSNSVVYGFVNSNPNIGLESFGMGKTTNFTAINKTNVPQTATLIMGVVVKHAGNRMVDVYEQYSGSLGGEAVSTEILADSSLCTARPDTIHVTVLPLYEHFDSLTVCSSELPYAWQGQMLTTPGDHEVTYKSVIGGCDSTYYMHFDVKPAYYYYDTITIPMWNTANVYNNVPTVKLPYTYAVHKGVSYVCDSTGDFEFNFKTADGCDSIAYVNVKTYPMMRTIGSLNENRDNRQIYCYGDEITLDIDVDNTYGPTNVVYASVLSDSPDRSMNYTGTTSVVYGFVNSNPNIGLNSYGIGKTFNFSAINKTNIPQEATIIMEAAVKHTGNRMVYVYEKYSGSLGADPVSVEFLADSSLCAARPDTIHVTVLPLYEYFDSLTVCSSELPYIWQGQRLVKPGDYKVVYESVIGGCDSTYYMHLILNPAYLHQTDAIELCASELPYNFNNSGKYITATPAIQLNLLNNKEGLDTFKFHYYTTEGCDSIVYVAALIHPNHMTILPTDTTCIGAYANHGFNAYFRTPGIYPLSRVEKSVYGCDSTINVSVFVTPNYYTKVVESICAGVPYINHGFSFVQDTAGTYAFRFDGKTALGCDSIIDVVLEVYPSYSKPSGWTHLYPSVCRGETYSMNGFYVETYKLPANKRVHNDTNIYKTVNGCDSVVHLQLTINDTVVTRFAASICLGDRYAQNGFSVKPTSAGVFEYQNARRTSMGCDSTAILTLTVNQVYNTTYYDEVCEGERYQKYGFNTIVTAGTTRLTQNYNTQRVSGCDSIVTVILNVHSMSASSVTDYICRSEGAYNKNGFHVVLPATLKNIVVRDTLHNYFGCDSISTLYLTIYDGNDTAITASVCEGERYHSFGFDTTIYVPGKYHFAHKLKNMNGCDSNITLTLTVKPVYTMYETVTICQGDSVNYNGTFYGRGTHKIVFAHSAASCDSTLYLTVNTNPIVRETMNVKVCRNVQNSYIFNGKNLTQTGTYTDTIPFNGCYKIVTLNLTFLDTAARPTAISGPMNIYTAGVYNYTCDTVPYNPNAGVPAVDAYLWETSDTTWTIVSSNMNTANINIPKPGSGFVFVSSHNECGYSSRTSMKVFAKVSVEDIEGSNNAEVSIFPNPTNAEYSIRINGMEGKTQISIVDVTGKVVFRENVEVSAMDNTIHYNAENYPKGVYMISILNGNKTVVKKLIVQ